MPILTKTTGIVRVLSQATAKLLRFLICNFLTEIRQMRRSIEPDESTRALSSIIRTRAPKIEQRWLRRVQQDVARKPDVDLTHLRDGIPDYLQALASLVSESAANDRDARGTAIWARVAHDHGITRVRIGFDIEQLIHEFIVLRQEVRGGVRERCCHEDDGGGTR